MSINFGGSSSSSRGRTQPLLENQGTEEEQALVQAYRSSGQQSQAFDQGLQDLTGDPIYEDYIQRLKAYGGPLPAEQQAALDAYQSSGSYLTQLQNQLGVASTQNLLNRVNGTSPILSPAEQAQLDAVYAPIEKRGMESLMQMGHDMAASRGMAPSDSPIGNQIMAEGRKFQEGLAGQKAAAAIDMGQFNANLNTGLMDFQARLKQQAQMNRLQFATAQSPGMQMQDQLYGQRLARAGQTYNSRSTGSQWNAGIDIGQILSAVAAAGCWVAEAIYGKESPEFWRARQFIMYDWEGRLADVTRAVYMKVGPWLGKRPRLARLLKPLFDRAVEAV